MRCDLTGPPNHGVTAEYPAISKLVKLYFWQNDQSSVLFYNPRSSYPRIMVKYCISDRTIRVVFCFLIREVRIRVSAYPLLLLIASSPGSLFFPSSYPRIRVSSQFWGLASKWQGTLQLSPNHRLLSPIPETSGRRLSFKTDQQKLEVVRNSPSYRR